MLYGRPRARVRTNDWVSDPFPLFRGTWQGCPLSPGLFALALQTLAISVRESQAIRGLVLERLEERISLYADDALLYLNDVGPSLLAVLEAFEIFGRFSAVRINWSKSVNFPLDDQASALASPSPLHWLSQFKYLGVVVTRDITQFFTRNILPLLTLLKEKCSAWSGLPLNLLGRINNFKMVLLQKFNYLFRNCPVWVPDSFFKEVDRCICPFIWNGAVPRLAKSTLQLPTQLGVLLCQTFKYIIGRLFWFQYTGGLWELAPMLRSALRQPS